MENIFFNVGAVFGIIFIILQVSYTNGLKKIANRRIRYYNKVFAISVASIISDIIFVIMSAMNDKKLILIGISMCVLFITHIILWARSISVKDDLKDESIRYNGSCILVILIVMLLLGITIPILRIVKIENLTRINDTKIDFLTTKYGEHNFKAIREVEGTVSGETMFAPRRVISRSTEILEPTSGVTFYIHKDDLYEKKYIDNFIEKYYQSKINKYLKKHNVIMSEGFFWSSGRKMSDELGYIPAFNELCEIKGMEVNEIHIKKVDFNYDNDESALNFIKELSYDIAICLVRELNIGKDLKLNFEFEGINSTNSENNTNNYCIKIQNYTLIIEKDKKGLISLDLNKIK